MSSKKPKKGREAVGQISSVQLAKEAKTPKRTNPAQAAAGYTEDVIRHFRRSSFIRNYINRKSVSSLSTGKAYHARLANFAFFVYTKYDKQDVDTFVNEIKERKHDPYDVLADFCAFLTKERKGLDGKTKMLSAGHIHNVVLGTKKFLRFCKIPVTTEDFKDNVSLPKKRQSEKAAMTKVQAQEILSSCDNMKLKVYCLFLGATGARPIEGCAVRNRDLDLDSNRPSVTFRAEYTKTKEERTRRLTRELVRALKQWLKVKYEPHNTTRVIKKADGSKIEKRMFVTPKPTQNDLVFGVWHLDGCTEQEVHPSMIYHTLRYEFATLIDSLGIGLESAGTRRKITFHSWRRFTKSTIADQGYSDYSEWFIGHKNSTYYRTSEEEKQKLFDRLEPYLTFLDYHALEAQGADIQSKLEEESKRIQAVEEKQQKDYQQFKEDMDRKLEKIVSNYTDSLMKLYEADPSKRMAILEEIMKNH